MTFSGKILPGAAILAALALQPAAAQEDGNGAAADEKPAATEALPSSEATPIVTPSDQPAPALAPDQPPPAPKPEETAQQPKPAEPAAKVSTFVQGQVAPILGKKVVGPDEKAVMGSIIDLLVDDEGKPRAVVLDLGGFLGVGSRHVAIDWQLLKFRAAKPDAPAVLNLDPADLKAAPEYKDVNAAAQVLEPSHAPAETPPPTPPATDGTPVAPAAPPADTQAQQPLPAPTLPPPTPSTDDAPASAPNPEQPSASPAPPSPASPSPAPPSSPPSAPPANNAGQ